jgi:hypothetical protein
MPHHQTHSPPPTLITTTHLTRHHPPYSPLPKLLATTRLTRHHPPYSPLPKLLATTRLNPHHPPYSPLPNLLATTHHTPSSHLTRQHPPYSPNLAPAEYVLFLKLKFPLKGQHFQTLEETQCAVTRELNCISKTASLEGMKKLKERVKKCIKKEECIWKDKN